LFIYYTSDLAWIEARTELK